MKDKRRENSKDPNSKNDSFKISTNENFYRSSNKFNSSQSNFTKKEIYGTLIQNIKLDIQNLNTSINEYSDILIFFKNPKTQSLLPQLVNSKIKDIEASKSQDINNVLETISIESQNIERIADNYSCKNQSDLVTKLALQVNLYDCFIKKLNDLSFLLNLRYNNEKNSFSESIYQDSFSKYNMLKSLLDKFISVYSSYQNSSILNNSSVTIPNEKKSTMITQLDNKEDNKLLNINSIEELMSMKDDDKSIRNIKKICSESFDNFSRNIRLMCESFQEGYQFKYSTNNNSLERMIKSNEDLEEILRNKDKLIKELKSLVDEKVNENNIKDNTYNKLNGTDDRDEQIKDKDQQIKSLRSIIDENNNIILNIKGMDEKLKNTLYEDIKDLTNKNSDLSDKYYLLINEHKALKKSFEDLSKSIKKGIDIESYEQLLQEQFDEMKKSFVKKIEQQNNTINDMKIDSRKKIYGLEEELKQVTYIKDVFLKQITELKKNR